MDRGKRIFWHIALDAVILICTCLPIVYFFVWGKPRERGFFCDDESLKYPKMESTVPSWVLYIIGSVVPGLTFLVVEFVRDRRIDDEDDTGSQYYERYELLGYEVHNWLVEFYKTFGTFAFGAAVCQLITDIGKYSIGRLRPHFFDVCDPVLSNGSTCANAANHGKYITDYTCSAASTPRELKEMRLSFPSGHSSFIVYTMIFTAIYLQARMKSSKSSKLCRHFLQAILVVVVWFTVLSRVFDYKHHWSDVLAGSLLGAIAAIITAIYISKLFARKVIEPVHYLPKTTPITGSMPTSPYQYR